MVQRPLRSPLRLLIPLLLGIAALPAWAADVDEVLIDVRVARSSVEANAFTAEIRVIGTGLNNGTIRPPGGAALPLDPDGDDLALGIDFASETQLAAFLPDGNYALSVNNGTVTAAIAYARPAVPSPAISQPVEGTVVPPGAVEVLFSPCPICIQIGDSVEALLEDDAMMELASDTLTSSDDAWTPSDGMGGDLLLGENSAFVATITHSALRQSNVAVSGADDPFFLFTQTFVQSDAVDFLTGFAPPEGDFCVAVNDATAPAGCSTVTDASLDLFDPGRVVSTTVDGHDVDYDFSVGTKGTISGTAMADLDDNGSKETVGAIKGKLKGKEGELKQKLSFPLVNEGLLAKLKVKVSDLFSIPMDSFSESQVTSGKIGATKIKEELLAGGPLPVAPEGWRVEFTVDAAGAVTNGMLTLEGGRSFVLDGSLKFSFATNLSKLKLQTADKGAKIQLKKVELDDEAMPPAVVGGDLSYKILGQKGKTSLP